MAADSGRLISAERPADVGAGVQLDGLTRRFGSRAVLDNVDLTIPAGRFVALLGKSGSGKSTLLRALAGIDHGVAGEGLLRVPSRTSMVFQDSRLLPWTRVLPNILFGQPRSRRAAASALLGEVGLAGREKAWPGELSGGEQQRAALARALVGEPELLLADEPFGALDALTRMRMHALLHRLVAAHRPTVLLVTHDVDEAITLAERVLILDRGRIGVDIDIDIDGPRDPAQRQFQQLRRSLLSALGADPIAA